MPEEPEDIDALLGAIRACRVCRDRPAVGRKPLPHEPRPVCIASKTARILIAGQAPGTRVQASGIAFSDPSGDRLREWLGVDPATFYDPSKIALVPMGFCFPGLDDKGSDLAPRRECAALWHDRLMAAMPQVDLVLAIGQYAQRYHLGARRRSSMTETVAAWREIAGDGARPQIVPLPHPSWRNSGWLKRHPWFASELLPYLRREVRQRT